MTVNEMKLRASFAERMVPPTIEGFFAVDLSGHAKTGQRWSGQNRPTEEAED
jgi:hypothetical protein